MQECVVFFCWGKGMLVYEERDIMIKCPLCNKNLIEVNSMKSKIYKVMCKRCRMWIWANPADGYREVKEVPPRTVASGMRFY